MSEFSKRPFCVIGGEIIGNVPTIEELAVYIKDYIKNNVYSSEWGADAINGATRKAIYDEIEYFKSQVIGQLEYKGLWDASGGEYPSSPELGWYYVVSVGGVVGGIIFEVGDWIVWNGTSWDKLTCPTMDEILYYIDEHANVGDAHHSKTVSGEIELAGLFERFHDSLQDVQVSQHHTKTVSSEISLNSLLEKSHISLSGVSVSQHHVKTVSNEIELAGLYERFHGSLQDVLQDQHHNKIHNNNEHTINYEVAFSKNTAFNKNFGVSVNKVCEGDDVRLSNARTPLGHGNEKHSVAYNREFPVGSIIMYSGIFTNNVTMVGWYKCDGNNGTVNLINKFVRGGVTSGATGGSDNAVVVQHNHLASQESHDHRVKASQAYQSGTGDLRWILYDTSQSYRTGYIEGATPVITVDNEGVSGANENIPAYYTLIFIQRIS